MKRDPFQAYYSKCLQVDLPGALRALRVPRSKKENSFIRKVNRRFVLKNERRSRACGDPFVADVVHAYRFYYREALLQRNAASLHEDGLKRNLEAILGRNLPWDELERSLKTELRKRGYHSLLGRVEPFRSLLVWKKETSKSFRVPLISGTQKVKVVLLDGFVELGWMHFLTLGRYYVGGWAKKDALYCVAQAYKRDYGSEAFRVSYLTHEAQHFSDYNRHPGLPAAELEYRAKLAELVASRRPAKLMRKFSAEAKKDPSLPHSYAAWRVVKDIGAAPVSARAAVCLSKPPRLRARPRAGTRR